MSIWILAGLALQAFSLAFVVASNWTPLTYEKARTLLRDVRRAALIALLGTALQIVGVALN
jgi:hypothetical protein